MNEPEIIQNEPISGSLESQVQKLQQEVAERDAAAPTATMTPAPPIVRDFAQGTIIHIRGVGSFDLSRISDHTGTAGLVGALLILVLIVLFRGGARHSARNSVKTKPDL